MPWDPRQYLAFAGPRLRPGLDLIGRIPELAARRIFDLGCGTGELTARLGERWPEARVTGLDSSAEMLERAGASYPAAASPRLDWAQGDIATWRPDAPPDLVYSNAALHWVGDHNTLFPRLMGLLAPGGALAVQMPRNFDQPTHRLLRQTVGQGPWRDRIALAFEAVLEPAAYYDLLAPGTASLDIWETRYFHVLSGENPVLDWVKGTALRPVIDALSGASLDDFLARYGAALAQAYPRRSDGTTLLPFRRLFMVARK